MLGVADTAGHTVGIEFLEPALLTERDLRRHIARRRCEELSDAFALGADDVPAAERVLQRLAVNHRQAAVEQAGTIEVAEDGYHATSAMSVFQTHVRHRWRHLAENRPPPRQAIDILHRE